MEDGEVGRPPSRSETRIYWTAEETGKQCAQSQPRVCQVTLPVASRHGTVAVSGPAACVRLTFLA